MNLRLFVFVTILVVVSGSWLGNVFKRTSNAVGKVFGGEFRKAGNSIDSAMESLERMSLTVKSTNDVIIHAPEMIEALKILSTALKDMKITVGADSKTLDLINDAMFEVHFALEIVGGFGDDVREASERFWLRPSLVLGDSVENMWHFVNRWIVAALICIAAGLLVQVIPDEHKSYRHIILAIVLVFVALFVLYNAPERKENWMKPFPPSEAVNQSIALHQEVAQPKTPPSAVDELEQLRTALEQRLRQVDCLTNTLPILVSLSNDRFQASSILDNLNTASHSKVNSGSAWYPAPANSGANYYNQYVEVRLDGNYTINQIDVHGRGANDQYVRKLQIFYKTDRNKPFVMLCPLGSTDCRFDGPSTTSTPVTLRNFLPFSASVVRLEPRDFNGAAPAFRWELFGCKDGENSEEVEFNGQLAIGF